MEAQILRNALAEVKDISTKALQKQLTDQPETVTIDVRTQREVELRGGTIKTRHNYILPRGWLEFRIADIAKR